MRVLFWIFFSFVTITASGQVTISLTDPDYDQINPLDCGAIVPSGSPGTNFIDSPTNYSPNMNETLVLCPDPLQGTKVSIAFLTNSFFHVLQNKK